MHPFARILYWLISILLLHFMWMQAATFHLVHLPFSSLPLLESGFCTGRSKPDTYVFHSYYWWGYSEFTSYRPCWLLQELNKIISVKMLRANDVKCMPTAQVPSASVLSSCALNIWVTVELVLSKANINVYYFILFTTFDTRPINDLRNISTNDGSLLKKATFDNKLT